MIALQAKMIKLDRLSHILEKTIDIQARLIKLDHLSQIIEKAIALQTKIDDIRSPNLNS